VSDTPKFLLDENIPKLLKKVLESKGYSPEYASKGINNGRLASLALAKRCVLVSRDRDFINPVLFPPKQFPGIIILVSHPPKSEKLIKGMDLLLSKVKHFKGKLFIVDEKSVEIIV
jgi:predicted nuclease of predicted toxin-antitoxin system